MIISFGSFSQTSSQTITVISPNGGENWQANSTQLIKWESKDVDKVKIEYSLDNGLSWEIIVQSVDAYLGEYSWVTADAKTPYVLIRISDVYNPIVYDLSDEDFALVFNEKNPLNKSAQVSSTTIKIMPLGDSITWGTNPEDANSPGFRRSLNFQLSNAGYNVDFVGSLSGGLPNDFDRNNEGHPGWSAGAPIYDPSNNMHTYLPGFLSSADPAVVLLLMGTNDITEDGNAWEKTDQEVAQAIVNLLDEIYTYNPDIVIFVAKIIDRADFQKGHDKTVSTNSLLPGIINSLPTAQKQKITIVDMYTALGEYYYNHSNLNFTYGTDNLHSLHPNNTGYQAMANTWFSALQSFYQPTLAIPPDNSTDQAINLSLSWSAPPAASVLSVAYDLQVAVDMNFTNIVFEDASISGTSASPTGLLYGTKYYWRVKIPGYGWSVVRNFTTAPLSVLIKVFLEGPYGSGTMSTALNTASYLPLSQPYFGSPWGYAGGENVSSGFFAANPLIVDWVLVELRSSTTNVTATKAAFLKNDGNIVDLDGTSSLKFSGIPGMAYYIVVKHRNHLAVMSSLGVSTNPINYDFTSGDGSQFYGANAASEVESGVWAMYAGDIYQDKQITTSDYTVWYNDAVAGNSGYIDSDCDLDGQANTSDYTFWYNNAIVGISSKVP